MSKIVDVEVTEILPSGIKVRTVDGHDGFIRHRELSWDERSWITPELPSIGQVTKAKVIRDDANLGQYIHLSLRELNNPWDDINKKYKRGQPVRGEVVEVRYFGVFVQIEPGITAIIWPKNVPLLQIQSVRDIFSIGDQVHGVITHIDAGKRRIGINLTKRLNELWRLTPKFRKLYQLDLLQDFSEVNRLERDQIYQNNSVKLSSGSQQTDISIKNLILVIDDKKKELANICRSLENHFDINLECASSEAEAFSKVEKYIFDLVIIDLKLGDENGLLLGKKLIRHYPRLMVIITSTTVPPHYVLSEIRRIGFIFEIKQPEMIIETIELTYKDRGKDFKGTEYLLSSRGNFVRELGMTAFANYKLHEVLNNLIFHVVERTSISQAMVLDVDVSQKAVAIIAANPPLTMELHNRSEDGLYHSPVETVILHEVQFSAENIDQESDLRFKHFFPLFKYKSCICLPLKISGATMRHVLVMLSEHHQKLTDFDYSQAATIAVMLRAAIERSTLLDYMQRYEHRYTIGQLLNSLVHEIKPKLDGFEGLLQTVYLLLQEATTTNDLTTKNQCLVEVKNIVGETLQVKQTISDLVQAYMRIASKDLEAVDVNLVSHKVVRQMEAMAKEEGVTIEIDAKQDLPLALAVQTSLEQILTNVILNALQQINRKRIELERIARERNWDTSLFQKGLIIIQTRNIDDSTSPQSIEILVYDTGPGIHHSRREKIFLLDTSGRRRGHGLGLYISRNLVEMMGGAIKAFR